MSTRRNRPSTAAILAAAAAFSLALFFRGAVPAEALDLRSITTVTGDYYFANSAAPESYYIETDQVLLLRVIPALSVEAKYTRTDSGEVSPLQENGSTNMFTLGPVLNFTDTTYAYLTYGLGFDSAPTPNLIHEVNASLNWETDLAAVLFNVKWDYFTSGGGNWYVLPSLGGSFHILPALGAFGEFFVAYSPDTSVKVTGAFWGEASYAFSDVFTLRAGFTMSFSSSLGFSAIAGADFNITPKVSLKYKASFLSNVVQYFSNSTPTTNYGIENLLSVDWKI
jgi:hypothetical protein